MQSFSLIGAATSLKLERAGSGSVHGIIIWPEHICEMTWQPHCHPTAAPIFPRLLFKASNNDQHIIGPWELIFEFYKITFSWQCIIYCNTWKQEDQPHIE